MITDSRQCLHEFLDQRPDDFKEVSNSVNRQRVNCLFRGTGVVDVYDYPGDTRLHDRALLGTALTIADFVVLHHTRRHEDSEPVQNMD